MRALQKAFFTSACLTDQLFKADSARSERKMESFQGPFFYPAGSPMPPVMGTEAHFWNMGFQ